MDATPTRSVHKPRGNRVLCMCVQLTRVICMGAVEQVCVRVDHKSDYCPHFKQILLDSVGSVWWKLYVVIYSGCCMPFSTILVVIPGSPDLESSVLVSLDESAPYIFMCQSGGVSSAVQQVRNILRIHSTVWTT